ncbi:type III PLP-dependent enzyme [Psychromonas aquimarina]|uniref:type III PLP-dependent enzyme n=1 Tax=Psychromonas aquimarina TaxID=444919 RepID=UPI0003FB2F55|nr:type III PLP-dependent enzyme [Psychromonas aquimarina]
MKDRISKTIDFLKSEGAPQTPLCAYIYDLASLTQRAAEMMSALPENCELYYASKANPEAQVLAALAPLVDGFEAASGGELAWLNECQPQVPLIFGGPGKLCTELELAVELGVEAIHVESLTELDRLQQICARTGKTCNVLLRMNISLQGLPSTKLTMGGKPTPFGFDESELAAVLQVIEHSASINLQGFHFHLMSHQLDRKAHLALMALYFKTFKYWCDLYQLQVPLLNVGGGIGINYADPEQVFDWRLFCAELAKLITAERLADTKIRFECGRYITADCGYYVMQVLDIKHNHGQYFAVGHGGTHHFRTPAAQSHDHPFFVCRGQAELSNNAYFAYPEIKQQAVTLVGQLCTPKDVLASQQYVEELAIGDYLVFTQAGAYAWNISHQNFLMHAPPLKHFMN